MTCSLQFSRLKINKLFLLPLILTVGVLYFQNYGLIDTYHLVESLLDHQNYTVMADKWIIIDVADISRDMTHFDIPGWRLLVLGDWRRNKIRCSNCIYFNTHSSIKVRTLFPTNTNMTNVKAQSVLFMIHSGAEWIFWSNGVNDLLEEINRFKLAPRQTGLIYRGEGMMHPSRHYTKQERRSNEQSSLYQLWSWPLPSIQKIWRPNMFANFSHRYVDYHAPPVLVPRFTFHTDVLKGSLFHRNAFWSLGPLMMYKSHAYILSFWIQRLLWEFDDTVAFLPPVKNGTHTLSEDIAETKYAQKELSDLNVLRNRLSSWNCNVGNTFYACVNELADMMEIWGHFTLEEVSMIKGWVSLLHSCQPKRSAVEGHANDNVTKLNNRSVVPTLNFKVSGVNGKSGRRVIFNPRGAFSMKTFGNLTNVEWTLIENPFVAVCKRGQSKLPELIPSMATLRPMDDILLIIIFNKPGFLDNIKYLMYMYGRHFTHILVCGDSLDDFVKFDLIKNKVSFIEMNVQPGFYGYQCMMEAMQIGYDVQGYLQMSDDVLLNVWNIVGLPRSQVWYQSSMRAGNLSTDRVPDIDTSVYWWGWKPGRLTLIEVWKDFSLLLQDQKVAVKIQTFLDTLELNAGSKNSAFYEASDIYYIPARLKDLYMFYSSWFLKHKVFLEIVIPTVINGLVLQKDIVRMPGSYLWNNRNKYRTKYNPGHVFLHPYKLNKYLKNKPGAKFICERYLSEIDNHLKKLTFKIYN